MSDPLMQATRRHAGVLALFLLATLPLGCSGAPRLSPTDGALGFETDLQGFRAASTGGTGPDAVWQQRADDAAVSPPNVLSVVEIGHRSEERFNLWWTDQQAFGDGVLSVAVRGDDGVIDQGGGPMWRVQDANNYYVCRFNPLEKNIRVYVVEDGVRRQLDTAIVEVATGEWYRVSVEHTGDHILCWLDDALVLEVHDGTITSAGGVGLWTKADARTSFDDFFVAPRM